VPVQVEAGEIKEKDAAMELGEFGVENSASTASQLRKQ